MFYLVGVKEIANRLVGVGLRPCVEVFKRLGNYLQRCERTPPCLTKILLVSDNVSVASALNKRLADGSRQAQYNVGAVVATYKGQGLRWGDERLLMCLPKEFVKSPWLKALPSQQRSVMIFSHSQRPYKGSPEQGAIARDVSQSCARVRYSKFVARAHGQPGRHVSFAQMPEQSVWLDLDPPRFQLGRESLLIQGFPIKKSSRVYGGHLRKCSAATWWQCNGFNNSFGHLGFTV